MQFHLLVSWTAKSASTSRLSWSSPKNTPRVFAPAGESRLNLKPRESITAVHRHLTNLIYYALFPHIQRTNIYHLPQTEINVSAITFLETVKVIEKNFNFQYRAPISTPIHAVGIRMSLWTWKIRVTVLSTPIYRPGWIGRPQWRTKVAREKTLSRWAVLPCPAQQRRLFKVRCHSEAMPQAFQD